MKRAIKNVLQAVASASASPRSRFLEQAGLASERDRVLAQIAANMPANPVLQGRKIYSQCDEDGIIDEIFRRIGTTTRTFVEFGAGDGSENNTHALLLQGWRGLWAEGDTANLSRITGALSAACDNPDLLLFGGYVTSENVAAITEEARRAFLSGSGDRIDLLSMDLDGNDLHFLERLVAFRPRVICAEYNALLGPEIVASVAYDANHRWQGDDYMGASLPALRDLIEAAGYSLVCCNLSGSNAFFVDRQLSDRFGSYTPEQLFQPARYHFIFLDQFHERSLRFLANKCSYRRVEPVVEQ